MGKGGNKTQRVDIIDSYDPRVEGRAAPKGTLFRYIPASGNPEMLIKNDDGFSTNWASLGGAGAATVVDAASVGDINLAVLPANIDGVVPTTFLAKDQALPEQNGVYDYPGAGLAATRTVDWDTAADFIPGRQVYADQGTVNADTFWANANSVGVLDVDPVTFIPSSSSAGANITLSNLGVTAINAHLLAGGPGINLGNNVGGIFAGVFAQFGEIYSLTGPYWFVQDLGASEHYIQQYATEAPAITTAQGTYTDMHSALEGGGTGGNMGVINYNGGSVEITSLDDGAGSGQIVVGSSDAATGSPANPTGDTIIRCGQTLGTQGKIRALTTFVEEGGSQVPFRMLTTTGETLDPRTDQKILLNDPAGVGNSIILPVGVDGMTFKFGVAGANTSSWGLSPSGGNVLDTQLPGDVGTAGQISITFNGNTWYSV